MNLRLQEIEARLGRRKVLGGVDVTAPGGEVTAIVGPNGAGKSTLLRVAAGVLWPTAGHVWLDGTDLHDFPARGRARRVALVPSTASLDYPFTVREVVAMGRYAHTGPFRGPGRSDLEAVQQALEAAHLKYHAHRFVTRLSSGEKQRVVLARSLAQAPDVLLLDEPTANLDLGQAAHVWGVLRRMVNAGGTVVAAVHDLEAASRVADRVVLMAGGTVVAHGPPRQVLTEEHLHAAFGVRTEVAWSEDGARIAVRGISMGPVKPRGPP